MPAFNSYPRLVSVSGDEVLVVADASGVQTLNVTLSDVAGAPAISAPSGAFYADEGGKIDRRGDRLFVGAASEYPAERSRDVTPQDWLSTLMAGTSIGPWAMQNAQSASLARYGTSGFVAGSRTSDARTASAMLGYVPSSIGIASWGVADETANPTTVTAYAFYGEGWRLAGVDYQPTFCMELEAVNFGGGAPGSSTPYHPNCGGGTYGIQLGAGGGQTSGTADAEAGIVFVNNPDAFRTGIIFGADALSGTDGTDAGYGAAISMARNHGIQWQTPETEQNVQGIRTGAMVYSTVSSADAGSRIQFLDNVLAVEDAQGNAVFTVGINENPTNTLQVQAGTGQQAAGLYVQAGAEGSANLGLYPAAGGALQMSSPVSNAGGAIAGTAGGGFLHININGSEFRIPLLLPTQAGG
ncbi:hypothetical protein AA101099_1533 [Neoasaia chiangmaiensis NBRC 101099]|uniref:Uncharacterized protein n=2 Tax=Neoasaia chiangmaiensis TaxID=320497 RepID=A0A1U9KUG8_9PROT|nr:hypothetical protein [Neoasaia chiangmaiensis]AQS89392.1 hypothetical protein A0U93_08065 [Neoasaia chiangmaiensis]GBR39142.1 hypothetical protein AA101099_1533 [Neoasaia chiangmaiensis NBRC 101099]GEN15549.1 hypothetical protein NCH01_19800 [Neoasaia chiangmaiensis]